MRDAFDMNALMRLKETFGAEGELNERKFVTAFASILGEGGEQLSAEELVYFAHHALTIAPTHTCLRLCCSQTHLFMKIDANSDGACSWDEFTNYMFLDSKDVENLEEDEHEQFVVSDHPGLFSQTNGSHFKLAEPIGHMFPLKDNSWVSCSKDAVRLWDTHDLKMKSIVVAASTTHTDWITSCIYLSNCGRLLVGSMLNSLAFYDVNDSYISDRYKLCARIEHKVWGTKHRPLRSAVPLCTDYFYDPDYKQGNQRMGETIIVGDDAGAISIYRLDESFFTRQKKTIKKDDRMTTTLKQDYERPTDVYANDKGHSNHVTKVEYIPEITSLVTSSLDGTLKVIDLERRKVKRVFKKHSKAVYSFTWCSHAKVIASCGLDRDILLWSPWSQSIAAKLQGHISPVMQVIANPETGTLISLSTDSVIKVWDVRNHKQLQTIVAPTRDDGKRIDISAVMCACEPQRVGAGAGGNGAGSASNGADPTEAGAKGNAKGNGKGSAVGGALPRLVTAGRDLRLWDGFQSVRARAAATSDSAAGANSSSRQMAKAAAPVLNSHDHPVCTALYNTGFHQVVSCDSASNVHVWSCETGKRISTFNVGVADEGDITAACFDEGGRRLITGCHDGHGLLVWNFSNGCMLRKLVKRKEGQRVGFAQQLVQEVYERSLRGGLGEAEINAFMRAMQKKGGHGQVQEALQAQQGGGENSLDESRKPLRQPQHSHQLSSASLDSESSHQSLAFANRMCALAEATREEARNGRQTGEVTGILYIVNTLPSIKGQPPMQAKYIVSAGWDRRVYVWRDQGSEADKKEQGYLLRMPEDASLAVHAAATTAGAGTGGADFKTIGHTDDILCLAYCPPNLIVTGGYDGLLIVWYLNSGEVHARLDIGAAVECVVHLQAIHLAVCGDAAGRLTFVNTKQGLIHAQYDAGHPLEEPICVLGFDVPNDYLVTGDSQGYVKVWDIYNPSVIETDFVHEATSWRAHQQRITSIKHVERDLLLDTYLLTACTNGEVCLWSINGELVGQLGQGAAWRLAEPFTYRQQRMHHPLRLQRDEAPHAHYGTHAHAHGQLRDSLKLGMDELHVYEQGRHGEGSAQYSASAPIPHVGEGGTGNIGESEEENRDTAGGQQQGQRTVLHHERVKKRRKSSVNLLRAQALEGLVGGRNMPHQPKRGEVWVRKSAADGALAAVLTIKTVNLAEQKVLGWEGFGHEEGGVERGGEAAVLPPRRRTNSQQSKEDVRSKAKQPQPPQAKKMQQRLAASLAATGEKIQHQQVSQPFSDFAQPASKAQWTRHDNLSRLIGRIFEDEPGKDADSGADSGAASLLDIAEEEAPVPFKVLYVVWAMPQAGEEGFMGVQQRRQQQQQQQQSGTGTADNAPTSGPSTRWFVVDTTGVRHPLPTSRSEPHGLYSRPERSLSRYLQKRRQQATEKDGGGGSFGSFEDRAREASRTSRREPNTKRLNVMDHMNAVSRKREGLSSRQGDGGAGSANGSANGSDNGSANGSSSSPANMASANAERVASPFKPKLPRSCPLLLRRMVLLLFLGAARGGAATGLSL
jgi:WD40 repeat protein